MLTNVAHIITITQNCKDKNYCVMLGGLVVKMLACCPECPGFVQRWKTHNFHRPSSAKSKLNVIRMRC